MAIWRGQGYDCAQLVSSKQEVAVHRVLLATCTLFFGVAAKQAAAALPTTQPSFAAAKTFFQTNVGYDPRIAMAVDAVVVHQHGAPLEHLRGAIKSWQDKRFTVGRMFFADSDATCAYWKGQEGNLPHPDEVERDAKGSVVLCANIRPYMLPTEGWIRHLEDMTAQSIQAGAEAILPEEPLAHVFTGYEKASAPIWRERFGSDWQPGHSSPAAHMMTAQLKAELYAKLEGRLAALTKKKAREFGRDIPFLLPIHSAYSNVPSRLTAPLGTSLSIPEVDGYVGQIWTGPINWVNANYNSTDKSFFATAYALYDYFVALADGTDRRLWLLTDPVEDDPNHKWAEFERWYRDCVVAELLFPQVTQYEVIPWPDRIFLPGYQMGEGTPGPENYRITILSVLQALQEMPAGGTWASAARPFNEGRQATPPLNKGGPGGVTQGIGVAVADSLMWQPDWRKTIQSAMGMMIPLIQAGVPVADCILERATEPKYLDRFKVIVLSQETCQPPSAQASEALAKWVRAGGSLIVLGEAGKIDGPFWWRKADFDSPIEHLLAFAKSAALVESDGDAELGRGTIYRRLVSPGSFGEPKTARAEYFPLLDQAIKAAGDARGLQTPGSFVMQRGPFIIAHAGTAPVTLPIVVDIFDPELPVLRVGTELTRGSSGIYKDVQGIITRKMVGPPKVLHTTHRLISEMYKNNVSQVVLRGPAETPAVVRIDSGGYKAAKVIARDAAGKELKVGVKEDGGTLRARFPNDPAGATLEIHWTRAKD